VSTLDVPAVAGARVRLAWDVAALAAATAGALLLLVRPQLGWGVLLMLAVAASALGATRRWWPILVAAVSLLGCAAACGGSLASEGPGADAGRWAALTLAVLVAAGSPSWCCSACSTSETRSSAQLPSPVTSPFTTR
jgi:hypothetical protein